MDPIEAAAALLGALSVWLMARQRPQAWPIGLAMVLLYMLVFWRARLYSALLLQAVFAVLQCYGWWQWRRGAAGTGAAPLPVTRLPWRRATRDLLAGLGIALALGLYMAHHTDAQLPWPDALLTGLSLVGQFWMAHKRLQCWPLWVAVDVAYVGLYLQAQLAFTALLYLVFIGLALHGWQQWRRALA